MRYLGGRCGVGWGLDAARWVYWRGRGGWRRAGWRMVAILELLRGRGGVGVSVELDGGWTQPGGWDVEVGRWGSWLAGVVREGSWRWPGGCAEVGVGGLR